MLLSRGDQVDRYEVLELLGTGGMGEVYRARDPKLARLVALKILRVDRSAGTDGAARLLREARAAAALTHPNVLSVYDVGDVQEPASLRGLSYIAMELVVGRSLRSYLGDASVAMDTRVAWLRDIARALGAAHEAGIVHRDVKPENVMVRADGVVKVLDFGIARRAVAVDAWSSTEGFSLRTADAAPAMELPTITGQGAIVGTPFYMAPEQLRGEPVDARVDQFAWGVVAYTLVTGSTPWSAKESIALLTQIVSHDPPPPAEVDPAVPRAVSDAIVRALSKRREDRFSSMDELLAQMSGTGPVARAPSAPGAKAPRRGSRAISAAALAGVVVLAGAAVGWRWRGAVVSPKLPPAALASPAAPQGLGCASNAECVRAHGGEAWHCHSRRHECVAVASEDCTVHAGPRDAEADDVVWIGGLYPTADHDFDSEMRAAELARQDFARALGPSAARPGTLHARPLALVMCDEAADEARAARHLAQDVEAPAVLGFFSAAGAIASISTELLPARVLSVVALSQAPELTRIPEPEGEPRLVWRTTLDHESTARPIAKLVSDVLEPAARAAGLGDRPMRVAAVGSKTVDHDLVGDFFSALRFNGKSAFENGASFRQFVVGAPDADAKLAEAIADFAPNVVYVTEHESAMRVVEAIEARWGAGRRPTYVAESGWPRELPPFVGRDASKRRRFFGVTNHSDTMTNAQLVLRYNTAYPDAPIERTIAPQPSYDGFYMLAYATYALGDDPVTGAALSTAIDRLLPPGRAVDVGPAGIYGGFAALRSGERVDLRGAIGSLDFDRRTGDAPIDYAIVCLGVDGQGAATHEIDSGLVYDARADKLVGALRCP